MKGLNSLYHGNTTKCTAKTEWNVEVLMFEVHDFILVCIM